MNLPTLDLALATWQPQGILRVAAMDLPVIPGVRYVVSWQAHGDAHIPEAIASRADILVGRCDAQGVAANRNNALSLCTADIVLHSDDDLVYTVDRLQAVRRTFLDNPDVDLATFRYEGPKSKIYPTEPTDLAKMPRFYSVGTIEIAVRRQSPAGQLRFNPLFGPGAPFTANGEDEIYLLTARRHGIRCHFFPITIATHNGHSTGQRPITDRRILHGMGAVIRLSYPRTALLRIPLKAWRLWRARQAPFFASLRSLLRGYRYAAPITL